MEHAAKTWQLSPKKLLCASTAGLNASGAPRAHSSNNLPSIHREEGAVGGVRYRSNLKKFVVEHRPSKFKWKLWMGTYPDMEQGMRAIDAARFYTGQENGKFCFPDSPAIFREQGSLPRPFSSISKEVKDKLFNRDVKRRAKAAVRKDIQARKLAEEMARQGGVISSVADVERGLLHAVTPSIGFDSVPPIFTPTTSFTDLVVFSNVKDCDEVACEESIPLKESQEGDVVDVGSSSKNLVAAVDDDPCHWLYPDVFGCSTEVCGSSSSYYSSFELDFDDLSAPEAHHNLHSSLDYIHCGDDVQEYEIKLWD